MGEVLKIFNLGRQFSKGWGFSDIKIYVCLDKRSNCIEKAMFLKKNNNNNTHVDVDKDQETLSVCYALIQYWYGFIHKSHYLALLSLL